MPSCFATGGSHAIVYQVETTFGTAPTPDAGKLFRLTQSSLTLNKDSFQSEELRGDQQVSDLRHGVKQVNGDLNFELSYLHFDDFIEGIVGGTWTSAGDPDSDTDWSVTAAGPTFDQVAGTDLTTLLSVGDYILVAGFTTAGNNGIFKVDSVSADSITVEDPNSSLVDEAAGDAVTIERLTGAELKAGLGQPSFTMEGQYNDITQYELFLGVTMNTMTLNIAPNAIVTGAFSVIGSSTRDPAFSGTAVYASPESVVDPSTSLSPMDAFSGTIYEGGTTGGDVIAVVTAIELSITRNLDPAFVIGSDSTVCIVPGRNVITGTLSAFFDDETLINKFVDETETLIQFDIQDPDGNTYTINLPRVKYSGADNSVTNEQGIVVSLPFTALLDEVTGSNIVITR